MTALTDCYLPAQIGDDLMKIMGHFRIPSIWYFCCQKVPFFHQNLKSDLLNISVSPRYDQKKKKNTL